MEKRLQTWMPPTDQGRKQERRFAIRVVAASAIARRERLIAKYKFKEVNREIRDMGTADQFVVFWSRLQ